MKERKYLCTLDGPGLIHAIQKSLLKKGQFSIVVDQTASGKIVRIGYFLDTDNKKNQEQQSIKWFKPNEVESICASASARKFNKARLDIEFNHPRPNERHFMISLFKASSITIVLRNLFRLKKNKISDFLIQVEINYKAKGKEQKNQVIRYDYAHGFFHRDMIYKDGHTTKHKLKEQNTKKGIVFAIDELRGNLNTWLPQLGYPSLQKALLKQPGFVHDIEAAKKKLIKLHDDPKKISEYQSTWVQYL